MTDYEPEAAWSASEEAERERHATNLELFLDLAFVFAVTQVTSYVGDNLTPAGIARGVLLAWFAWWQWTVFTWAGTAVDFEGDPSRRVMVLMMIPAVIIMAVALPYAFGDQAVWFGSAYFFVQLWVLVIQGADALKSPGTAQSFLNYAPAAAIAPALIFIGSLLPYGPRLTVWIVAGLLFVASALAGGRRDHEWAIDPVHFSERHALFVIISLGEVLVAIGTTAADTAGGAGLNTATAFAVLASLATASVIWWSYFAFVPTVLEQRLRLTEISGRGRIARDVFSFGHFPIVSGIIAYAVVAKHLVQRPSGLLTTADRTLLLASAVLFVGGLMNLQWRCARTVAWYRAAAIGISLVPFALAGSATGVIVVALQASILGAMAIAASHRFRDMSFSSYPAGKTTKD